MPHAPRAVLAIDMSPFGQSLALIPAMRALRASYPATLLVAAAAGGTCELLSACGVVDETIDLGVIKFPDRGFASALKRLISLGRRSRHFSFDLVLDFSPRLETQIVSRLVMRARTLTPSKLPRVLGMLLELGGVRDPGNSGYSSYANVLQQAGVEMKDAQLGIVLPEQENARFEHRLAIGGSRGGELIALLYAANPEAGGGWPVAAFGEIGARLTNNLGARIIAADEPSDKSFTDAAGQLLPRAAIKLSEPHALELVAAIARASIVITDEPGVANIASEVSTPVIEIADAMSAAAVMSRTHRIARSSSRARVSTDEVFEIACEMIQESRSPSLFERL